MLYFDEAGYTGPNLTSVDQPIYTMGSVNFNDDELDLIRRDIGYDAYGKELHFKSMYTNPQGREMLKKATEIKQKGDVTVTVDINPETVI
mgnify:CR=1 FL=1